MNKQTNEQKSPWVNHFPVSELEAECGCAHTASSEKQEQHCSDSILSWRCSLPRSLGKDTAGGCGENQSQSHQKQHSGATAIAWCRFGGVCGISVFLSAGARTYVELQSCISGGWMGLSCSSADLTALYIPARKYTKLLKKKKKSLSSVSQYDISSRIFLLLFLPTNTHKIEEYRLSSLVFEDYSWQNVAFPKLVRITLPSTTGLGSHEQNTELWLLFHMPFQSVERNPVVFLHSVVLCHICSQMT